MQIKTLAIVGDLHVGSDQGLLPPGFKLDGGQKVGLSDWQKWLWRCWNDYWHYVDQLAAGGPFAVVVNGDIVDGRHHNTLDLITGNKSWQQKVCMEVLKPRLSKASKVWFVRGTPAHTGQQSEDEELVARDCGGIRCKSTGRHTHQAVYLQLGNERIHIAHHIAYSGSHAYKSSPAMRLMASAFAWAGETGNKPPTIMVRSHAHDYIEVKRSRCRVVVCPCWQGKTGWAWMKDTISTPTIGGLVICQGELGVHIREKIYQPKHPIATKL